MSLMTPESVLGIARQFMESRILLTACELGVFDRLVGRSADAVHLAAEIGGDPRAIGIILDATAAMGLLAKDRGLYTNTDEASLLLTSGSDRSVLPMLLHSAGLWKRWSALTDLARGQATPGAPAAARSEADLRAFIGAMHVVSGPRAAALVAAVGDSGARRLIDVGGASGSFTIAFLRAIPDMTATLFDLPPVAEMARVRLNDEGLLDRVRIVAGDFATDGLPPGHDLALLSAIIHQNSPDENEALYRNVCGSLDPGGRLIIRDHVMSEARTEPRSGAVFAVNMLCGTRGGNCYTFAETRSALESAGFERVRLLMPDTAMDGLIEAYRA